MQPQDTPLAYDDRPPSLVRDIWHDRSATGRVIILAITLAAAAVIGCLIWQHAARPSLIELAHRPISEWGKGLDADSPWPARHPWLSGGIVLVSVFAAGHMIVITHRLEDRR